ncbi:sulfurtransferase [Candidatus Poribacteria bacterium]|nr:sulfurtransferase [Candidatus Poribacteria bacterium]
MTDYARPELLVTTDWVAEHAADDGVRLVEVDVDTNSYGEAHIAGAVGWNWETQLCDPVRRDILTRASFEDLLSSSGIGADTTIVFYGDNNNWFATYALWQCVYWGHPESGIRLMDGGRAKWIGEGRPTSPEAPLVDRADYGASLGDDNVRAFSHQIHRGLAEESINLIDVRSPVEFSGDITSPPGMPETAQRGGHIPGAVNVPWSEAVHEDGTFRSAERLLDVYGSLDDGKETIAYCRIGERSSHTWFVLTYLLGHDKVRNYDGSWTEWGNLVAAPIARGQ